MSAISLRLALASLLFTGLIFYVTIFYSSPKAVVVLKYRSRWRVANFKNGSYVGMCGGNFDGRRLGNQLFNYAAMLYVVKEMNRISAELSATNKDFRNDQPEAPLRKPVMPVHHPHGWLDRWFAVEIDKYEHRPGAILNRLCPPCTTVGEERGLAFSKSMNSTLHNLVVKKAYNESVLICGWFQSWKYTVGVEDELRKQLRFNYEIRREVDLFLESNQPSSVLDDFIRVGVHVRRGDIVKKYFTDFGYTTVDVGYLERAMAYFTSNTSKLVQFVIISDDRNWTREAISENATLSNNTRLLFSEESRTAAFDLALMASCDHSIMTTGTFGWWGAWLANGTTIYYKNWPSKGSPLAHKFNKDDFFPPSWIAMP